MVLHRLAIDAIDPADRFAHQFSRAEHGFYGGKRADLAIDLQAFIQQIHDRLGGGKVAGAQQDDDAVALLLEHMHLGEGRDIIDPGIGPSIGQQHHPVPEIEPDAVSH